MKEVINAMTIDVEDYFHVSAFEKYIKREDWDQLPCQVEKNSHRILDLFDTHNVKATFFVLGWVAERYPAIVHRIVADGHELASHGYSHVRATMQQPDEFREDVQRTKKMLEDLGGCAVRGYRATSYSIVESNLWALDVLEEVGYEYSSSIYPVKHDLYGIPHAPRFAFYPKENKKLLEIPITTVHMLGHNFPGGGGGFFRLLPYPVSRWLIKRVNKKDHAPGVFYLHPWEIEPDQPRQKELDARTRFRHYLNLEKTEQRLDKLLRDFQWGRMDEVFLFDGSGKSFSHYSL